MEKKGFKSRKELANEYNATQKTLRNWLKKQPAYVGSAVHHADANKLPYSPNCLDLIYFWLGEPESKQETCLQCGRNLG